MCFEITKILHIAVIDNMMIDLCSLVTASTSQLDSKSQLQCYDDNNEKLARMLIYQTSSLKFKSRSQ